MSKFKLGILIVFGMFILIGVIVFASSKSTQTGLSGDLTMWGTVNQNTINDFLVTFSFDPKKQLKLTYVQKNPENFGSDLAEAIADGKSPDIVLLPIDTMLKQKNRLLTIPFKSYPERTYKDTFLEYSEIFLTKDGVLGVPLLIDPLVMYWNRDIFSSKLKTSAPLYWDQFQAMAPEFVEKDSNGNIKNTLISFGEWRNVTNAKEIFSNLLIQAGSNITKDTDYGLISDLSSLNDRPIQPALSALNFYTQFANPTKVTYSWNRSLPKSLDFFLSGNLATYMGMASELPKIRSKNPNLNFDIALIPQIKGDVKNKVFSKIYGLSIVKSSNFIPQAFSMINTMTSNENIKKLEKITNLPPVRKDLLSEIPTDSYRSIFYKSAIWSTGFKDVDSKETDSIFQYMIESITSGRSRVSEAINDADESLNTLIRKNEK